LPAKLSTFPAEAKEKLTEGLDLEEQKQLVEDEVELELVENELCHYQKLSCHTRRRNARLKGLRDTLEGKTPSR
jgi:hypothetical protein